MKIYGKRHQLSELLRLENYLYEGKVRCDSTNIPRSVAEVV